MKDRNKPEVAPTKRVGKPSGYKSSILWARREKRHNEAEQRQAIHDGLTIAQKIAKAKKRGGSQREIKRLTTLLGKEPVKAADSKVIKKHQKVANSTE